MAKKRAKGDNDEQAVEASELEEATEQEELSAFDLPSSEAKLIEIKEISLDQIAELPNIRQSYHGIEGLAETMHLEGQLQPCWVRPAQPGAEHGKPYELIFGYRRKRAAELLNERGIEGWETLRCEVREINDGEELSKVIVENFQREDPSPVAEAKAMLALKQSTDPPMTNEEVARRLGVDASQVSKRLAMLNLGISAAPKRPALSEGASEAESAEGEPADVAGNKERGTEEPVSEAERVMQEAPEPPSSDTESGEEAPVVASSEQNAEPEIIDAPQVDILEMVDKGEISASHAEIIATLDDRRDQEKLAVLVKRHQWPVRKAEVWARKVKEHQLDEGGEEMGPVEWVTIEDVVEIPRLHPRADITDAQIKKITAYALLRNGMDREVLEYLDEEMGYPFSSLWDYVSLLSEEDVDELIRRLALRYVSAAHRYHDLEPTLKDELDAPAEEDVWEGDDEELALPAPAADDMAALPSAGDGADDFFGLPAVGESSAEDEWDEEELGDEAEEA